jgi:hypothetical protein
VRPGKIIHPNVNQSEHLPLLKCLLIFEWAFSNNVTRKSKMTKTLAILFAGLFATATAFAQAPAAPAAAATAVKKEEAKPAAKKEEAKKPAAKKEEAKPAAKKEEAKK